MDTKRWDIRLKIKENKNINLNFYRLTVVSEEIASVARAGQFCMLQVDGVFLRRPLSIFAVNKKTSEVSFLYKTVGKGTEILASLGTQDYIKVLGPLGSSYPLEIKENVTPVLVAGGTGIASISCLASSLKTKGYIFYGVRTKDELMLIEQFEKDGWKIFISTEDGSLGYKGYITDVLQKQLKKDSVVYVCGPTPMMKKVVSITLSAGACGYASLEEKMACGLGNCQGCAVKIGNGHKMTCKDGPVFPMDAIVL